MKILIILLFSVLFSVNSMAATIYIRTIDGGIPGTECDGTKDLPKRADKHCAYKYYTGKLTASSTNADIIHIGQGSNIPISIGAVSVSPVVTAPNVPAVTKTIELNELRWWTASYAQNAFTGQVYKVRRVQSGKPDQYFMFYYLGNK